VSGAHLIGNYDPGFLVCLPSANESARLSVARRTREIGIRMALGARPNTVQWMILREGSFMLAGGIVTGLVLAIATGRILSGILYQVGALDPIAFSIAPLLLAAATLLATWLPARRATRISPMMALRTE